MQIRLSRLVLFQVALGVGQPIKVRTQLSGSESIYKKLMKLFINGVLTLIAEIELIFL